MSGSQGHGMSGNMGSKNNSYNSDNILFQDDLCQQMFDELFYCREQNPTELKIKYKNKEKNEAEQKLLHKVQLTDFNHYLDTFTVSKELVQNAD